MGPGGPWAGKGLGSVPRWAVRCGLQPARCQRQTSLDALCCVFSPSPVHPTQERPLRAGQGRGRRRPRGPTATVRHRVGAGTCHSLPPASPQAEVSRCLGPGLTIARPARGGAGAVGTARGGRGRLPAARAPSSRRVAAFRPGPPQADATVTSPQARLQGHCSLSPQGWLGSLPTGPSAGGGTSQRHPEPPGAARGLRQGPP